MNLLIFRHNKTVQVLDETTYIWEGAKIIGLKSDWSVKLKWVDWSSKPAIVITVPDTHRAKGAECWNIRKFQKTDRPLVIDKQSRKTRHVTVQHSPDNHRPFTGNPAKLTRNIEVG